MSKRKMSIIIAVVLVVAVAGIGVIFATSNKNSQYPPTNDGVSSETTENQLTDTGQSNTPNSNPATPPDDKIPNDELDEQMRNDFHGAYPNTEIDAAGNVYVKNDAGNVIYTGKLDANGKAILYDSNGRAVGEASISGKAYSLNFYNGNYIEKR